MKLRVAALALGVFTGFVFGWARLTDPNTFYRMFTLRSPFVYLLMGSAVAVAFVGARLLRGRRAVLTGTRIDWHPTRPSRSHILGSVVFGVGWGVTEACPGPAAAQVGGGRLLTVAVVAGILVGVKLQPSLARALQRRSRDSERLPAVAAADIL